MLLESLDLIEKNFGEKLVKEPPATAQLPSPFPMKTILVAWVAQRRQTPPDQRVRRSTFEEARKAEQFEI
ncbi:uncharacterized protein LACBIDRAFT_313076 [Laccaria bicolor S238N-H82]|uniref:Predicted protein n=1 Tax=Laccaria bicolor (strain S238N-H82 / ATCC MYA-4686) TaxID=486041 RepID=B0DXG9_LACBS|nr:uncharacterized protein LACBIDRAFT_313076 [Laccaria bicolor S238N-H82]EDR00676.1 predicted protein [Laccaria bicolor S238N-H82]|eukprot:XP_001888685.1 predicted protein [Laccaria bicolor S238N-H82]